MLFNSLKQILFIEKIRLSCFSAKWESWWQGYGNSFRIWRVVPFNRIFYRWAKVDWLIDWVWEAFLRDREIAQVNDMNQALRGSRDYELSREYVQFKIRPDVWFQLSATAQSNKMSSFLKHPPSRSDEDRINITETINNRLKDSIKSKKIKK